MAVGDLHPVFGVFGIKRAHHEWNDVHRPTAHRTVEGVVENAFHFRWVFPVIGKTSVFFFFGADKRPRLYAGNISGIRERRIRIRKLRVRETNQ